VSRSDEIPIFQRYLFFGIDDGVSPSNLIRGELTALTETWGGVSGLDEVVGIFLSFGAFGAFGTLGPFGRFNMLSHVLLSGRLARHDDGPELRLNIADGGDLIG
jgi:hypothetical protein